MQVTNHLDIERGTTATALVVSGIAFALFMLGMILFGRFGGSLVNALSEQIGEVVAQRATDLAAAGDHAQAVKIYKDALACRFEDEPMQRIYAMLRLAKSHLALEQSAEALSVLEQAYALDSSYGPTYTMMFESLKTKDTARALAMTKNYLEAARARGDIVAQKWAKYNEGVILRDSGKTEEALAAFTESHALQPSQESAYQCAHLQYSLGKLEDARDSLADVLDYGDEQYTKLAHALRDKLNARESAKK